MKFALILFVCSALSLGGRLIFLGQASLSDYSPAGGDSSGCQYDAEKFSSSVVIQYQFALSDMIDGGVELDVFALHPYRWIQTRTSGSTPSRYIYDYREYSLGLFLAVNRDYEHVTAFAKVIPGLYLNTLNSQTDYYGYWMSEHSDEMSSVHLGL